MHLPNTKHLALPLSALSVFAIASFDWGIYAANMLTQLEAFTTVVVLGSLAAGLLCGALEHRKAESSFASAFAKASFAAIAVALPLPFVGTLLAGLALLWRIGVAVADQQA